MKHEIYWLDETDPSELERRAEDMERSAHYGIAEEFRIRSYELKCIRKISGILNETR